MDRRSVFSAIAGLFSALPMVSADRRRNVADGPTQMVITTTPWKAEAERLNVALAGVSTVASGGTQYGGIMKPDDWGWHPAYQDVLDMRRKHDAAIRYMADTIPLGNMVALYPCGCSASGSAPGHAQAYLENGHLFYQVDNGIPRYCSEHDPEMTREHECTVVLGRRDMAVLFVDHEVMIAR
jgi:hypothetical protein